MDEPAEFNNELLDGPDYKDFCWWDETSMFDPNPTRRWCYGIDCYEAKMCCRVPVALETEEEIQEWIYQNEGRLKFVDPPIDTV
jgi:hypothetical protein